MRLLVIEDEHRIANYIKKGLELKTHVVDLVYDGDEGLDLASSGTYDVIILDRMLPGVDGLEICKQLRSDGIHAPILMLTAKSQVEDKVEGLDSGADDYLGKPFAFNELLARIKALSRRPKQQINSLLSFEDLTVNTDTFQVTRGNSNINLTKKEFALLEFLIRHPNQVVTSEQIIEQVWPYDSDVLPNTAQVYVGYLRNKIDKPFNDKPNLIQTLRGFGYKLGKDKS